MQYCQGMASCLVVPCCYVELFRTTKRKLGGKLQDSKAKIARQHAEPLRKQEDDTPHQFMEITHVV